MIVGPTRSVSSHSKESWSLLLSLVFHPQETLFSLPFFLNFCTCSKNRSKFQIFIISDLFWGPLLDLVYFFRSREKFYALHVKIQKKYFKYKNFSKIFKFFFLHCLSYHILNNTCLLIFLFCDRYSGNAGEILKNQALKKNINSLFFFSPSIDCSKDLSRSKKMKQKEQQKRKAL